MKSTLWNRLSSPVTCLLASAAIFSLFTLGRLHQSNFDFSSFVVAGDRWCDPAAVPPELTVLRNSPGFDGQFYYRLGLNPFTSQVTDFGITIDAPALRHQRFLFPLLAWALSTGNPQALLVVMVLINFLCLCVLGWIGGHYAQALRQNALWGILLPLYPGFLLILSRDLVEILEITLFLTSLLLLRRRKPIAATVLLSLAVLTKETALLIAIGALLVYVFKKWKGTKPDTLKWHYFAVPILVFAILQVALFYNWGVFPVVASGESNLATPFVGPAGFLFDAVFGRPFKRPHFIEAIFLVGFIAGLLYHLRSTAAMSLEIVPWLLYAVLAVSLGRSVWAEDWTFFRALSQFYSLSAIIIIGSKYKTRAFMFGWTGLLWLYLFIRLMRNYS